jgi:hypothetical protein
MMKVNREKIGSPVETLMGLSSKVERKEMLDWVGLLLKSWRWMTIDGHSDKVRKDGRGG